MVAPKVSSPAGGRVTRAMERVQPGPVTKRMWRTPPVSAALALTTVSAAADHWTREGWRAAKRSATSEARAKITWTR